MIAGMTLDRAGATSVEAGFATHTGRVSRVNEDRCLAAPELGIFAVADGMGGHADGAFASTTIVDALASIGTAVSASDLLARLEDRILRANAAIWSVAQARATTVGAAVAILLLFEENFACVWSGDSRVYRIRGGSIFQISRDHTHARDLLERGLLTADEAKGWLYRNAITRAVGVNAVPEMELEQGEVEGGDVFVVCSDGLTAHVEDAEILLHAGTLGPQAACDALLALTLERGASDNVTLVVVRCHTAPNGGVCDAGTVVPGLRDGRGTR